MAPLIMQLDNIWHKHKNKPMVWGESDCAILCHECFLVKSGEPLLSKELLDYSSEAGAMRMLLKAGVNSVHMFLQQRLETIKPNYADIGDLLYFGDGGRLSFPAVVLGEICVSKGLTGPVALRRSLATHGFKVPCRL